jgi:hypothetical protein
VRSDKSGGDHVRHRSWVAFKVDLDSTVRPTRSRHAVIMSTLQAATELPASASHSPRPADLKPRRLLACVLCQQRKVRCDHEYPCATCVKARVPCVPATQFFRRRRRFPERELLGRLRKYEELLSQHNIKFEPLHPDPHSAAGEESPTSNVEGSYDSDNERPGTSTAAASAGIPSRTTRGPTVYETK